MNRIAIALGIAALLAGQAGATTITWGPATDTTGASDVSTAGTLVKAFNSAGASDATVNGVTFVETLPTRPAGDDVGNVLGQTYPTFNNGTNLPDAALNSLLTTGFWTTGTAQTPTLHGLTIGTGYEIQLFVMDQRPCCDDRIVTFTSGANSVALDTDPGNAAAAPFGQFTIGTFTADATTQTFAISGPAVLQVNGWQLRDLTTVPEPASLTLVGLGIGLLVRQRRLARS